MKIEKTICDICHKETKCSNIPILINCILPDGYEKKSLDDVFETISKNADDVANGRIDSIKIVEKDVCQSCKEKIAMYVDYLSGSMGWFNTHILEENGSVTTMSIHPPKEVELNK